MGSWVRTPGDSLGDYREIITYALIATVFQLVTCLFRWFRAVLITCNFWAFCALFAHVLRTPQKTCARIEGCEELYCISWNEMNELRIRRLFDRRNVATKTKDAPVVFELYRGKSRRYLDTGIRLCAGQWSTDIGMAYKTPHAREYKIVLLTKSRSNFSRLRVVPLSAMGGPIP